MCSRLQFQYANDASVKRFNLSIGCEGKDLFTEESNRYDFHFYPIIRDIDPDRILEDYTWGLIPPWATDDSFKLNNFHARVETLSTKKTWKSVLHQRCLVVASGYYEWKHIVQKGNTTTDLFGVEVVTESAKTLDKEKHIIHSRDVEIFSLAGLWSHWINPVNGQLVKTFTVVTTDANVVMSEISNELRMPIMLKPQDEQRWLGGEEPMNFSYPGYDTGIIAVPMKK